MYLNCSRGPFPYQWVREAPGKILLGILRLVRVSSYPTILFVGCEILGVMFLKIFPLTIPVAQDKGRSLQWWQISALHMQIWTEQAPADGWDDVK